ncbi:MAG: hypothetical protein E4H46_01340 [Desulfobacterales bacterium]|nr:MAG: hypothetical protein E4H46_01340 [Desulfobacterales bacterium]
MTAYRLAIDQTTQTIDMRAKYYRILVIAVVLVSLVSIIWSLIAWAWSPLACCFSLIPVCGFYFSFDNRLLNHWQSRLLDSWSNREIDFHAFSSAVSAISTLPEGTVQGMLATLPQAGDLLAEQKVSPSTRQAVAALFTTKYACRSDMLALKTVASTIVAVSVIVSIGYRMWQPLLGMMAVIVIPLAQNRMKAWRFKKMKEKIAKVSRQPDFNKEKYLEYVDDLSWAPLSVSEIERLVQADEPHWASAATGAGQ